MNLFLLNKSTYEVDINPEALLLKPFHKILARDRSQQKKKAKAELAYVWFMCDYKSDYQSYLDEEERSSSIVEVLEGLPKEYKPDKLVKEACEFYRERSKTVASSLLEDQKKGLLLLSSKVKEMLEGDEEVDVSKVATVYTKIPALIKALDEIEKVVKGQQELSSSTHRGSQDKAMYEDGF